MKNTVRQRMKKRQEQPHKGRPNISIYNTYICYSVDQSLYSQSCAFSSDHVCMWELDYKESWAPENWCFWTVVLEKTLESPLDCKEIQPVHPKGDQSWVFIGRTDAEAETPVLWPPDKKSWLTGKDPDAGKGQGQEEKGTTEDEMVWWHQRLSGHEFEQGSGVGVGQGSLARCSPWGCKESDTTEQLNKNSVTSHYTELWTLLIHKAPYKERRRNDPHIEGHWPVGPALVLRSGDSVANTTGTS